MTVPASDLTGKYPDESGWSPPCSHPDCRQPAGIYIGTNEAGKEGWVCEKHIQFCSITDDGAWVLHRHIAAARKAQAEETWKLA